MDNKQKKGCGKRMKICAICILAAIAILLLIQKSENGLPPPQQETVGKSAARIINFDGWLKYVVSKASPDIELTNPVENTVYFIFEIVDSKSGKLIARTDKVAPGQRTYVNIADFYSEPGRYYATLILFTYDAEADIQEKGLSQGIEIEVN